MPADEHYGYTCVLNETTRQTWCATTEEIGDWEKCATTKQLSAVDPTTGRCVLSYICPGFHKIFDLPSYHGIGLGYVVVGILALLCLILGLLGALIQEAAVQEVTYYRLLRFNILLDFEDSKPKLCSGKCCSHPATIVYHLFVMLLGAILMVLLGIKRSTEFFTAAKVRCVGCW